MKHYFSLTSSSRTNLSRRTFVRVLLSRRTWVRVLLSRRTFKQTYEIIYNNQKTFTLNGHTVYLQCHTNNCAPT